MIDIKFDPKVKYFCYGIIFSILLVLTRVYSGFIMIAAISILYLFVYKTSLIKKVLIVVISFIVGNIIAYKIGLGFMCWNLLERYNLSYIDHVRKTEFTGGSQVLQNLSMSSFSRLIFFIPIGLVYFLFSPFPWHIGHNILENLASIENIFWDILFFWFFIKGCIIGIKKQKIISLSVIFILVTFSILYSITMGNMGISFRMRGQLLPFFIVFISLGLENFIEKHFPNPEKKIIMD